MRIRQVRPEFFTDHTVALLPVDVRLTYIGLWCAADDAGWLVWDVDQLGALLYPYESIRVRTRRVEKAGAALVNATRLVMPGCGCAFIPTLTTHQKIGGNKSFTVRDKHEVHTSMDKSARNVTLGNVRVGNVIEARARASGAALPPETAALYALRDAEDEAERRGRR